MKPFLREEEERGEKERWEGGRGGIRREGEEERKGEEGRGGGNE